MSLTDLCLKIVYIFQKEGWRETYKWKTFSPCVDKLKKVADELGKTLDELVK